MRSLRRAARRALRRITATAVAATCGWLWLRTGSWQAPTALLAALLALAGTWRFRPRGHVRAWRNARRRRPALRVGSRAERLEQMETHLYFWWLDGKIVYIGITNDADARINQHRVKPWHVPGVVCRLEATFPTRSQALEAEEAAIRRHRPRYDGGGANVFHNQGGAA